jgi:hypothetical protein
LSERGRPLLWSTQKGQPQFCIDQSKGISYCHIDLIVYDIYIFHRIKISI